MEKGKQDLEDFIISKAFIDLDKLLSLNSKEEKVS